MPVTHEVAGSSPVRVAIYGECMTAVKVKQVVALLIGFDSHAHTILWAYYTTEKVKCFGENVASE